MKKTMKKLILGVVLGISVLGFTGVGFVEAVEYFQVAKNNVAESVQENIPVGVEIDRMQVILN